MIHYQLHCGEGHEFDGWFRDSASFDAQARRGLLECPVCGGTKVARALMAPAVPKKKSRAVVPVNRAGPPDAAKGPVAVAGDKMPDHVRAMLQRVRAEVEKHCDYVGPEFAEEARRIHAGESERRGIYGEATSEQAEALVEDGIEVARIPWVPRADG
jgi:hypothetical protein